MGKIVVEIFMGIVTIYLLLSSIKFISIYIYLLKTGIRTTGSIIAFDTYRYNIMYKNTLIPKVLFFTANNDKVINIPNHSFLIELFSYKKDKSYNIIYDKGNSKRFIIENKTELFINSIIPVLIIGAFLVYVFQV